MDNHLLSLAAAARLLGMKRRDVQALIQGGDLQTFEGQVRVGDLRACFPHLQSSEIGELKHLDALKHAAGHSVNMDELAAGGTAVLEREVMRLRRLNSQLEAQLSNEHELAEFRGEVISELRGKLEQLKDNCDRREAAILGTITNWLIAHSAERQR